MEGFTLNSFILWIISGGATVIVRLIAARIPVLKREFTEGERGAITMLASIILIVSAFFGAVWAGYIPQPTTELEWFEALFVPVATALGIPALMTTTIEVRAARYNRKHPGIVSHDYARNRLLGIKW